MITLQIDNSEVEKTLLSRFKTANEIKDYLYQLVNDDIEERKFLEILKEGNKKDFVTKEEIFKTLDEI